MKKRLYVMIGIPASGKSTFASSRKDVLYVSRDEIRLPMLKEEDDYFLHEPEVFSKFIEKIQEGLDNGRDVIADATHISRGSRAKLLNALKLVDTEVIGIYVDTPFEICLERNSKRQGRERVPGWIMSSMNKNKSFPKMGEGFHDFMIINGGI